MDLRKVHRSATIRNMDIDSAIRAHAAWKLKLSLYIKNPDGSLDPNVVGRDNHCDLGKWIYGEGARLAADPQFSQLKVAHSQFHRAAGNIIRRADAGENVSADISLSADSDYGCSSQKVTSLLMSMRKRMAA
jgi:hypothetical protein